MTQEKQAEFRRFAEWFKEQYGYSPPYDPIFISTYKNRPEYKFWASVGRPSTRVTAGEVRGYPPGVAEEFLAREEDDQTLPTQIEINGKLVPVTWEELADIIDSSGNPLTLYVPILPAGVLQGNMADQLFGLIKAWDVTSGKFTPTDREELMNDFKTAAGEVFSPQIVFNWTKLPSVKIYLEKGGFDPSLFGHPAVESFLEEHMQFQTGDRLDPAYLEGLGRIMKEVQANPSQADTILAKYAPTRPQTQEQQIAQWGQQQFQGQQALQTFWGLPKMETFETEKEYQQNVVNQLREQAEGILASGVDLLTLNPLTQAYGRIVGQYQASQQRLVDIESGAAESWSPQIRQEQETERQRIEAEETARKKAIKPRKTAMELEFERLVAESRRPQRITRL